ncbi:MAG: recombination mediator RecR [bacterium]
MIYPNALQGIIDEFESLPGIGPKMAGRIALNLFRYKDKISSLKHALNSIDTLRKCIKCNAICEGDLCNICSDGQRDSSKLMIVEDYFDEVVIENADSYKGYYYIIEGLISPINNVLPSNLRVDGLTRRISELSKLLDKGKKLEIVFALNPSLEGDSTMIYIQKELESDERLSFSRFALGVPRGSDLDYVDSDTLKSAYESRSEI